VDDTTVKDVLDRFPRTSIDRDNFALFEGFLQKRLLINRCQDCGQFFQPPWPSCPNCWSDHVVPTEVSGRGVVHTFVILHTGPLWGVEGVDYGEGYPLAVVELEEQKGLRATGTIVTCANDDIRIGMPVTLTWIERGGNPIPAFQPAAAT
jgi:uncharacterized OB-fold protein